MGQEAPGGFVLERAALTGFRQFAELSAGFDPHLTVLVAPNSGGKTSILRALSLALEPFTVAFQQEGSAGLERMDVRQILGPGGQMVPMLPASVEVEAEIGGRRVAWALRHTGRTRRTARPASARPLVEVAGALLAASHAQHLGGAAPTLPVLGLYDTGRLWSVSNGELPNQKRGDPARQGYFNCWDGSASFGFFADWFAAMSSEALQERAAGPSPHRPSERLEAVQRAVAEIMAPAGWSRLRWDFVNRVVLAEHRDHGHLPVSWLSDGIKSAMAMVADLAHRCVRLNPHLGAEAPQRTPGVVLVDEVDMHLHPGWQQAILSSLRRAFPRVQFVVTTHSPQVLSTVPREQIRLISVDRSGMGIARMPLARSYGEPSGDVLQAVMGVDPQPPVPERADLQRLTELADQGQGGTLEATDLLSRLTDALGDHPQLQRVRRTLRRHEVLRGQR